MKLENQVCTRQQAGKLRELGIQGHGYFLSNPKGDILEAWTVEGTEDDFIAAWTAAELGVILPKSPLPEGGITYSWYHRNNWRGHSVGYEAPGQPAMHIERFWFSTEAEARAELLIYLLENNYITVVEVNARLEKERGV